MAGKQLTAWKAVAQETAVIEDDGDILLPLKRLRDQYTRKAEEIDDKMPGKGASDEKDKAKRQSMLRLAAFYRSVADSLQRLIGVASVTDFIEAPAPVDQTEEILSDDGPGTQAAKLLAAQLGGSGDPQA